MATDIESRLKKIEEKADIRDLTFAENFNGRNYALMDLDWIGYFDTLEQVEEFLGIGESNHV